MSWHPRIVTTGSVWIFAEGIYCRFPKQEGPRIDSEGRPRPDWGAGPGAIQDFVWHPYIQALFVRDASYGDVRMVIEYPDIECASPERCTNGHFILTGPVLEPIIDPTSVEMSELEHRVDYFRRRDANTSREN